MNAERGNMKPFDPWLYFLRKVGELKSNLQQTVMHPGPIIGSTAPPKEGITFETFKELYGACLMGEALMSQLIHRAGATPPASPDPGEVTMAIKTLERPLALAAQGVDRAANYKVSINVQRIPKVGHDLGGVAT